MHRDAVGGSYDGTILLWDVKPYLQENETL